MARLWNRYNRWIGTLLFGAGLLIGTLWDPFAPAAAQQRFGRDEVKSVPDSFIEGGDRSYTTLKAIAESSKSAADSLAKMEKSAADADRRHRELLKKMDGLDSRLKQMNEFLEDAI